MAVDRYNPVTGAPEFLAGGPPDVGTDETLVAAFAAERGTRLVGTTAERTKFAYARVGFRWYDTTLGLEFLYTSSGWKQADVTRSTVTVSTGYTATFNQITKDGDGMVEVIYQVGRPAESGLNAVLGVVPPGFRPPGGVPFAAAANGGAPPAVTVLQIESDGRIVLYNTTGLNKSFSVIARYRAA